MRTIIVFKVNYSCIIMIIIYCVYVQLIVHEYMTDFCYKTWIIGDWKQPSKTRSRQISAIYPHNIKQVYNNTPI